jgi:hypothetical protein
MDPGTHVIQADAPGKQTWSSTIVVSAGGETLEVLVPPLEAVQTEPAVQPPAVAAMGPEDTTPGSGGRRPIALVVGGAGVVGVGVGVAFGLVAISQWSGVSSKCPSGHCPDPATAAAETDAKNSASTSATVSTVSLLLGGAALATGLTLWLTASHGSGRSDSAVLLTPFAGAGMAGAGVRGTF